MLRGFSLAHRPGQPLKSILESYQVRLLRMPRQSWPSMPFPAQVITSFSSMSLLTDNLACLPSLRPLLVAIMGDTAVSSSQRGNGSGRPSGASNSSNSTHIIWPKTHQETYIRAGSQSRSERSNKDIADCQDINKSKDVFVRHDVSVVGEKYED